MATLQAQGAQTKPDRSQQSGLLSEHELLHERLLALRRVATLQLEAKNARAWNTLLEQKQHLLDQIESTDIGRLFLHTGELLPALTKGESAASAERLARASRENIALVEEVARIEEAAEARLKEQLEDLQKALSKSRREAKVNGTYRKGSNKASQTPRFLDGRH